MNIPVPGWPGKNAWTSTFTGYMKWRQIRWIGGNIENIMPVNEMKRIGCTKYNLNTRKSRIFYDMHIIWLFNAVGRFSTFGNS